MASFVFSLFLGVLCTLSAGYKCRNTYGDGRVDAVAEVSHMLRAYDLPEELLPVSLVTEFDLDREDGAFTMKLERSCYASLNDEYLWYGEVIRGKVRPGRIEDLSGVQSKMFMVWIPVKQLHVDDAETGYVYLEVGLGYKKVPASEFQYPLPCSADSLRLLSLLSRGL